LVELNLYAVSTNAMSALPLEKLVELESLEIDYFGEEDDDVLDFSAALLPKLSRVPTLTNLVTHLEVRELDFKGHIALPSLTSARFPELGSRVPVFDAPKLQELRLDYAPVHDDDDDCIDVAWLMFPELQILNVNSTDVALSLRGDVDSLFSAIASKSIWQTMDTLRLDLSLHESALSVLPCLTKLGELAFFYCSASDIAPLLQHMPWLEVLISSQRGGHESSLHFSQAAPLKLSKHVVTVALRYLSLELSDEKENDFGFSYLALPAIRTVHCAHSPPLLVNSVLKSATSLLHLELSFKEPCLQKIRAIPSSLTSFELFLWQMGSVDQKSECALIHRLVGSLPNLKELRLHGADKKAVQYLRQTMKSVAARRGIVLKF